jgi:hypothetical protein
MSPITWQHLYVSIIEVWMHIVDEIFKPSTMHWLDWKPIPMCIH